MSTTDQALPETLSQARSLLDQAKRQVDLAGLIMAGTRHLDHWVIENRLLPELAASGLLCFHNRRNEPPVSASLLPLADGSAFVRDAEGLWWALDTAEASFEIERIGTRFAPGNRWQNGFSAEFESPGQASRQCAPQEVADYWQTVTGQRPAGFDDGRLDEMEALGVGLAETLLHTRSRLGL